MFPSQVLPPTIDTSIVVLMLYHFKAFYARVVPANGAHPEAVVNITLFGKEMGQVHFSYRSDRKPATMTLLEEAYRVAGENCTPVETHNRQTLKSVTVDSADVPSVELAKVTHEAIADAQIALPKSVRTGKKPNNWILRTRCAPMESPLSNLARNARSQFQHDGWRHSAHVHMVGATCWVSPLQIHHLPGRMNRFCEAAWPRA